jgi:hypothetical protein
VSNVTSGPLVSLAALWLALGFCSVLHLTIGGAQHLRELGEEEIHPRHRTTGTAAYVVGVTAILLVSVWRTFDWKDRFGLLPATTLSLFLFLGEIAAPTFFGYCLAHAWLHRKEAVANLRFFREHDQQVKKSQDAASSGNATQRTLREEAAALTKDLERPTPEQRRVTERKLKNCRWRLQTKAKWNPARPFEQPRTVSDKLPAPFRAQELQQPPERGTRRPGRLVRVERPSRRGSPGDNGA